MHQYKGFGWDEMNNMYPFELDMIYNCIKREKDKVSQSEKTMIERWKAIENIKYGEEV